MGVSKFCVTSAVLVTTRDRPGARLIGCCWVSEVGAALCVLAAAKQWRLSLVKERVLGVVKYLRALCEIDLCCDLKEIEVFKGVAGQQQCATGRLLQQPRADNEVMSIF